MQVEDLHGLEKAFDAWKLSDMRHAEELGKRPCGSSLFGHVELAEWLMDVDRWIENLERRLEAYDRLVPTGPLADGVKQAIETERARTKAALEQAKGLKEQKECPAETPAKTPSDPPPAPPPAPPVTEPEEPKEDILEEIDEVLVPS